MKDRVVTLKNYETIVDAMVDQDVLKANNVECFIGNENLVELFPMFSDTSEGLKIVVFEKDYDLATQLITEYHSENIDE